MHFFSTIMAGSPSKPFSFQPYHKLGSGLSASMNLTVKVAASVTILSPTTVQRIDYSKRSDANASSMLIQNIIPKTPSSCTLCEPDNFRKPLQSGFLRHRYISENRALASWISLMVIQHKLALDDPGICFDELELLHALTYHLTKLFQLLNPPTPAIFIALLYLSRIFPDQIPYSGNPDDECASALQRLFLLCLRLALQWFEDQSEFFDFRARHFEWHKLLELEQPVFRNAEVHILHLLGHNLCVSNIAYARWLSHLLSTLSAILNDRVDEHRAINRLIHAIRPSLTPDFLHANRLSCSGLPFDKSWKPALSCPKEFAERGRNLMDCITFRLSVPLYTPTDILMQCPSNEDVPGVLSKTTDLTCGLTLTDPRCHTTNSPRVSKFNLNVYDINIATNSTSLDNVGSPIRRNPSPEDVRLGKKKVDVDHQPSIDYRCIDSCIPHLGHSQLPKSPFPHGTRSDLDSIYGAFRPLLKILFNH